MASHHYIVVVVVAPNSPVYYYDYPTSASLRYHSLGFRLCIDLDHYYLAISEFAKILLYKLVNLSEDTHQLFPQVFRR